MSGPDDRLAELRQELAELDETPLSDHPNVLEQTHRALAEELERLEDVDESADGGTMSHGDDGGPAH